MVLRLLILQPEDRQRAIVFNTSYNRSLLPDANAIARLIACLRIVFTDLNKGVTEGKLRYDAISPKT